MARQAAIACLLLTLLVAVTPLPGSCEERARMAMAGSSLIQCYDPLTNATNDATESFRASLLPLLAALPSAAAPTGFASLRSESSCAFVRGLCFGDATVPPSDCHRCLSVAASNLTSGCGATTRRAGIWTDSCFVSYADTDASSPAEDAFRSRVLLRGGHDDAGHDAGAPTYYSYYLHAWLVANMAQPVALSAAANISGPRMLATAGAATPAAYTVWSAVRVLAQCARDRAAAECVRCLQDSARAVDWDVDADRRDGGVAAAVVAFDCYLRFEVATTVQTDCDLHPFIILIVAFAVCALLSRDGNKTNEEKMIAAAAGEYMETE